MTINTHTTRPTRARPATVVLALTAAAVSVGGCRGDRSSEPPRQFFPDMDLQPKVKPQSELPFFEDGKSTRPLVENTVPWGATAHDPGMIADAEWGDFVREDRARALKADRTFSFGLASPEGDAEPVYVDFMPVEVDAALMARGRERFDIYCSVCHGYTGRGDGMVGKAWSYPPANLLTNLYRDRATPQGKDGYLFHIIREGLWNEDGTNRMPSYAHAVSEADAWAIVAYVRALQESQGVAADTLDPAVRGRLEQSGGTP